LSYSNQLFSREILGFGASEQFLAEVEDVEEYPVNYEQPASDDPKEYLKEDPKRIKGSIEFELKMVTLIADKNCDGVRILSPEEEKERNNLHSPTRCVENILNLFIKIQYPLSSIHCAKFTFRMSNNNYSFKSLYSYSDVEQVAHLDLSKSTMALQMEDSQIIPVEPSADERFTENGAVVQHPIRVECAKQNESMGSCLRTSMEICIDSVSEGLQAIAQEIIIDDRQELFQDESVEGIFASQTPSENSPLDLSLPTPYDGPPILSPNYEASSEDIPTHSAFSGDDPPPALTKQYEVTKNGRGRPRKSLNRKRSPKRPRKSKSRKTEIDPQDLADGKSSSKEHKDAHAQHRNTVPVVIPHSSAEIQERVKNRQRKTTQSYGSSSSVDTISEADAAEKPEKSLPKLKSRKRKLSSESSNSESKRKNGKPQNGLFIVEKILKKGIINGRPYFFVKWLNYPP